MVDSEKDNDLNTSRQNWIQEQFHDSEKQHYLNNDYLPEHFTSKMDLEARKELTCHLLGEVMSRGLKHGLDLSLADCRAYCEANKSDMWLYAVTDKLPDASSSVVDLPAEGDKAYEHSELEKLLLFDIRANYLANLSCIKDYLTDLNHHRFAVYYVWQLICEYYDFSFRSIERRIVRHELDKFEIPMIVAYAAKAAHFKPYAYVSTAE